MATKIVTGMPIEVTYESLLDEFYWCGTVVEAIDWCNRYSNAESIDDLISIEEDRKNGN